MYKKYSMKKCISSLTFTKYYIQQCYKMISVFKDLLLCRFTTAKVNAKIDNDHSNIQYQTNTNKLVKKCIYKI